LRNFASDNASGAHPKVLEAMVRANPDEARPYGDDDHTGQAEAAFQALFGSDISVYFVFNGTGANVLSLKSITRPYHAVICADVAHINVDETGAPEHITGCKLLPLPSDNGKLRIDDIRPLLNAKGVVHHSQPKVISITQATEMGAVYSVEEIRDIADFAHANGLYLHMDGARIANACAALDTNVAAFTRDAGVDVLSFGGAKNGMAFGEAVVFFDKALAEEFGYLRKQNLQLLSKMRFLTCQFAALLTDGLWLETAAHANAMARRLARGLHAMDHVQVQNDVQANLVFAIMRPEHIEAMQKDFYFYEWDESIHEVRLVCSFDTKEEDVDAFLNALNGLAQHPA
jgi:threonine aldolase